MKVFFISVHYRFYCNCWLSTGVLQPVRLGYAIFHYFCLISKWLQLKETKEKRCFQSAVNHPRYESTSKKEMERWYIGKNLPIWETMNSKCLPSATIFTASLCMAVFVLRLPIMILSCLAIMANLLQLEPIVLHFGNHSHLNTELNLYIHAYAHHMKLIKTVFLSRKLFLVKFCFDMLSAQVVNFGFCAYTKTTQKHIPSI